MAVSRTLLVLTLLFLILTSQLFAKSGLPPALELLLSGQSADYYAVASSLDESDLPTALAVIRLLKFKSAHREIRLSVRDIKSFRNSIRARIESSETISFKKNEVCITKVSARTIAYESREVRVPPFFVASLFFRIVTVSPRGEAGTVLPDLAVRFKCAKLPVKAKMAIDGKRVRGLVIRDESVFYRPKPEAKNMLSIGKHKAAVLLMDADGRKRKKVWYFTVGEESVPAQNIPQGSVAVGQVSMPLSFFHLGKSVSGSVIVKVYEDGRGNRKLKYFLLKSGSSKSLLSTTSLKGFRRITAKEFDYGKVTTAPTTPFAFDTNEFTLKYEYIGPGNVLKTSWEIEGGPDGSDPIFSSDKKVPWELKEYVSARLHLVVRFPAEDDESEPFEVDFDETVSISSFKIDTEIFEEYDLAVTQTGTGSIELDGTRELWNYTTDESSKLIEGESIPILNKGKLIVNKARWKVHNSNTSAEIQNAKEELTKILFKKTGFVEVVHDIDLTFRWSDESYPGILEPKKSGLYGVFPYKAKTIFTKLPPGIILNTSRPIIAKEIQLTLNGDSRVLNSWEITPPIILGKSTLFDDKVALAAKYWFGAVLTENQNGFQVTDAGDRFELFYNDNNLPVKGKFPFQLYFKPMHDWWKKSDNKRPERPGKRVRRVDWDEFYAKYRPVSKWLSVPAFLDVNKLIHIEITTDIHSESSSDSATSGRMYLGQRLGCNFNVVPVGNFGTGRFSATDKTLNILKGYKIARVEDLEWQSLLDNKNNPQTGSSELLYVFDPQLGTGTYQIKAEANITLIESDTNSETETTSKVSGSIDKQVSDGLKIITPVNIPYPKNSVVDIFTSFDDNLEEWKKSPGKKALHHGFLKVASRLTSYCLMRRISL